MKFETERIQSVREKANSIVNIVAYGISTGYYFNERNKSNSEIENLIRNQDVSYIVITYNEETLFEYNHFNAGLCNYTDYEKNPISYKWSILKSYAPIL